MFKRMPRRVRLLVSRDVEGLTIAMGRKVHA